jgi:hypothetical protein
MVNKFVAQPALLLQEVSRYKPLFCNQNLKKHMHMIP